MPDEERRAAQDAFLAGRTDVIVATNAFGMGVDKAEYPVRGARGAAGQHRVLLPGGRPGGPRWPPGAMHAAVRAGGRPHPGVLPGRREPYRRRVPRGVAPAGGRVHRRADRVGLRCRRERDGRGRRPPACCGGRRNRPASGWAQGAPPVDMDARALKTRRDRERLDTMVRYAFSRGCRTRFVYDYFAGSARGRLGAPLRRLRRLPRMAARRGTAAGGRRAAPGADRAVRASAACRVGSESSGSPRCWSEAAERKCSATAWTGSPPTASSPPCLSIR